MLIHNISSKHDRETTDRNIVSETLDGLLPILELKLKCCFCTVFHWIAIHFLIHYLPFNIFAMCCSFSISRALNKAEAAYEWSLFSVVCLRFYILAETVSLSKIWKSYPLFQRQTRRLFEQQCTAQHLNTNRTVWLG